MYLEEISIMSRRILIISQYYFPENFRINDIAIGLSEEFEVEVLTAIPNYPYGKKFSGYRNRYSSKKESGVLIHRCPIIFRGKSKLQLLINYLSFIVTGSLRALTLPKYDVTLAMGYSPIFSVLPTFLIKSDKKLIWIQDLWPESLRATGVVRNTIILSFLQRIISIIYRIFDIVIIQSNGFREYLIKNHKMDNNKIVHIPNHFEDISKNVTKDVKKTYNLNQFDNLNKPIILFAGNIGSAQNLNILFDVNKKLCSLNRRITWVLVGDGSELASIRDHIKRNKLNNFYTPGSFPVECMGYIYAKSDALFVSLRNYEIFNLTIPNKVQSYMSSGIPIIGSISGSGSEVISKANCGFCSPSEDVDSLVKNIDKFLGLSDKEKQELGLNGRNYFENNFSRDTILKSLKAVMT